MFGFGRWGVREWTEGTVVLPQLPGNELPINTTMFFIGGDDY